MILVIVCSRKLGINPDNVATPIAASLGDLITLSLLSLIVKVSVARRVFFGPRDNQQCTVQTYLKCFCETLEITCGSFCEFYILHFTPFSVSLRSHDQLMETPGIFRLPISLQTSHGVRDFDDVSLMSGV